jgi:hypothetical protein
LPEGNAGFLARYSAGSRVAGYRLDEQIGRGGMAVVFRAFDDRLSRKVALKILAPALAEDEAFRRRFIRESRSAAAVDDPHIVPVYEAGEADGVLFLAMRYVPGGDACKLVDQAGPLAPPRAAGIVSAVASALDAAHAAGLVHRDVKPANMLVDARPGRPDHVYLSDFGLTQGTLASRRLTGSGQFLGTMAYCAPEQIQGETVTGLADQYALACAAFELLCGEPPFSGEEGTAVLFAHLSKPPPALSALRPGVPAATDAVLARAMAKNPADRYATCREFAEALRAAFGLPSYDAVLATSRPVHPVTEAAEIAGPAAAWAANTTGLDTVGIPAAQPPPLPPGLIPPAGPGTVSADPRRAKRRKIFLVIAAGVIVAAGGITAAIAATTAGSGSGQAAAAGRHTSALAGTGDSPRPRPGRGSASAPGQPATVARGEAPTILHTLREPAAAAHHVTSIAFSPDGRLIVTSDKNGNAYLWSASTGRLERVLPGSSEVFADAFSPGGVIIATGAKDGSTYLWNAASGALVRTIPGTGQVNSLAFSPRGNLLAVGNSDGTTYLWQVSRDGSVVSLAGELQDPVGKGIWAVAFSPAGTTLATGDYVGVVDLWNVPGSEGSPARSFNVPGQSLVTPVAFSPDGATLAAGSGTGTVYLWKLAGGGSQIVMNEPSTSIWGLTFSRTGMLAMADSDGNTYLRDPVTGQLRALADPGRLQHGPHYQGVGAVAFSPDGSILAAGDSDGPTFLWNTGSR